MSMIRAQEYFAPLRSRHISLQQWERGLLFESWGRRGGRADRRKSGHLDRYMSTSDSDDQEVRPVKRVIARSVSFSGSFGKEIGAQAKNSSKGFPRDLSSSRSLTLSGEIIPEDSDQDESAACSARTSTTDRPPMFPTKPSPGMLFSRSLNRGRIESELSGSNSSRSGNSSDGGRPPDLAIESRPWPKKFFSGGLSFSKDRKFFSGGLSFTKPSGRGSDGLQVWGSSKSISSPDRKNAARTIASDINQEGRGKKRFFARFLSFSRSLDSRREISSSEVRGSNKLYKSGEIHEKKLFRRDLSFSRSLDPRGEIPSEVGGSSPQIYSTEIKEDKLFRRGLSFSSSLDPRGEISPEIRESSPPFYSTEIQEREFFGRDLSFSRSLDPDGDCLSSTCNSSESSLNDTEIVKVPELSWSKRFLSRSGLFFSKSLDPKRYKERSSAADIYGTGRCAEKEQADLRSKRLFGRGFSLNNLSRFLDPIVDSGTTSTAQKVFKELRSFQFKNLFSRGLFSSNSKTLDSKDETSVQEAGHGNGAINGSSDNNTKSFSRKFFSRDWSWSRSKSTSALQPMTSTNSKFSLATINSTQSFKTAGSNSVSSSPRNSKVLKYWWSKRSQNTGITMQSGMGNDHNSRLVLLEKVPGADDQGSDDLTVYVGERGGSLTRYVLTRQILRHHLFQVLLKCSQDELGSDHDYESGVPIICDPALFLQVARVVGGSFSAETHDQR